MTEQLEPLTPAFESGEQPIFPFMRKMIADLGLAAGAEALASRGGVDGGASDESIRICRGPWPRVVALE